MTGILSDSNTPGKLHGQITNMSPGFHGKKVCGKWTKRNVFGAN